MKPAFLWRCFAALVLCFLMLPAQSAVLKIATISTEGSDWMLRMRKGAEEVKTRTQGRVEFKFYTGGTMGDDKAVLRKVRIGQLSGGAFPGGALSDVYKDSQVYNLPLKFRSFDEVDAVRTRMDPVLLKGFEEGGWVTFGIAEGGFAYAMSKNAAVASVTQLHNQKIWAPSDDTMSTEALKSFQVTPIPLALGDVLAGLQTGLVNTVAASPIGTLALQWHTQVKYLTDLPIMYIYGVLAIDKKQFMRLEPADQLVVREVMGRVFREIDKKNRQDNLSAFTALLKQGIQPVKPGPQELAEWYRLGEAAQQRLVNSGEVSRAAYDQVQAILTTVRAGKAAH